MKHAKVMISIAALAVIVILVVVNSRGRVDKADTQLPPPDATLAGPQAPIPENMYDTKVPLLKNRTQFKDNMKIEVTKEGTGASITNGQTAVVDYVGKLSDGTIFDASKNHGDGSFSFSLGAGQVIKGWDEGVLDMKVGESRTLTIPPDLAYGPSGIPPVIPPNATLVFDVTLLGIK